MSTSSQKDQARPSSPASSSATAPTPQVTAAAPVPAPVIATGMPFFIGTSNLPSYRGDPHTIDAFKEKILRTIELVSLSPNQQVQLLIGQLDGPAAEEVRSWPSTEKTSVDQILNLLKKEFEVQSPTEVRLKFYDRRQKPGETLREYALALQAAYRSLCQVDTIDPVAAQSMITDRFIEGVDSRLIQSQLRMLAAQNPTMSFLDFKTLALRVVGTDSPCASYTSATNSPDLAGGISTASLLPPVLPMQATQTVQSTPVTTPNTTDVLAQVVDSLCQALKEIKVQPSSRESSLARTLSPEPRPNHPRPDRLPPERSPRHEPPYCTYCERPGHYKYQCYQLNGPLPRPRAAPRVVNPRAQRDNRNGFQSSSRNART
ncbi:hypothetical protein GDO81_022535 [Engystomops pustulosus]|uniref:Paraneoplastic antigen Ma-like C-terminal domain-containing protein n=1 Tax=Engystomops pustulosus TaxID=76066 RepID=A0AAV6YMP3_ENGPU|nr:hypothetical protein GDO81_022535 [Engystomops pustulosus]